MKRNLLYVGSDEQLKETKKSLLRLGAEQHLNHHQESVLRIAHPAVTPLDLTVILLESSEPLNSILTKTDIDILVYDERNNSQSALSAFELYAKVVSDLAYSWGPDFNFPLKRAVAILEDTPDATHRAFSLGRKHVQDVLVDPHSVGKILNWIAKILSVEVRKNINPKAGMAMSGGALEGFLYQLGASHAFNLALPQKNLLMLDVYSGVSSGSILSAFFANGIEPLELIRSVYGTSKILPPLKSSSIYDLAAKDIAARILESSSLRDKLDPSKWINNFIKGIPTGFFRGEGLKTFFEQVIAAFSGATNEFHSLKSILYVGATDQDQLTHEVFGVPKANNPTISEAVQASCALPPFYTPVTIGGRRFIDGQVTRTSNLELLVEAGCQLIFVIDPLKPFSSQVPGTVEKEGGIFALIQTVKALVYTRFQSTLAHLTERYPDVDFIVLQPDENITRIMSGSPMRYRIRCEIIELAYRSTLRRLIERHDVYSSKLAKHGFILSSIDHLKELERTPLDI
jgi:NTE family protein